MPQAEYISTFNGKKIYAERAEKTKTYGYDIDSRLASLRRVGPLIAGDGIKLEDGASGVRISAYGPTGACGPRGDTGNAGSTGPCGPKGACGPIGYCGPKGACGPLGFCGPKGACGPLGYCGPVGSQGYCGPLGFCGPLGACGPRGACGPLGFCGPKGGSGLTGYCGPLGFCGPKGGSGPQGFCGPGGFCGPRGAGGNYGATGPCGPLGFCGPKGWLSSVTWPKTPYAGADTPTWIPTTAGKVVDSWGANSACGCVCLYNMYTSTSAVFAIDVTFRDKTADKALTFTAEIDKANSKEFWGVLFVKPGSAYEVFVKLSSGTADTLNIENQYVLFNG